MWKLFVMAHGENGGQSMHARHVYLVSGQVRRVTGPASAKSQPQRALRAFMETEWEVEVSMSPDRPSLPVIVDLPRDVSRTHTGQYCPALSAAPIGLKPATSRPPHWFRLCLCALPRPAGVLLGHGAGGDMNTGNLPALAQAFADAGYVVVRLTCKPPVLATRVKAAKVSNTATRAGWNGEGRSLLLCNHLTSHLRACAPADTTRAEDRRFLRTCARCRSCVT